LAVFHKLCKSKSYSEKYLSSFKKAQKYFLEITFFLF
jgi:hypothetical protein